MNILLVVITSFFWLLLLFYSILTIAGVYSRSVKSKYGSLEYYPPVSVLIPAHNEGVVIQQTLHAMSQLEYPGQLNVFLLDDSSTDNTSEIAKAFQELFAHIHYIPVPVGEPRGKSRVLNFGLSFIQTDYFVVFDADNQPEPEAVRRLVEAAESTKGAAGAVGYVKTQNAERNLLTRMISLEFQVFQLLMQSGRWQLFRTGSLAGTNMLLKKQVVMEIGGYDVHALAEDAELTIRLTAAGYLLPVAHQSVTWEQEPETLKAYIKQRTRWLIGNIYLLEKVFTQRKFWRSRAIHHTIQHIIVYLFFAILLLSSQFFFIGSLFNWFEPAYQLPLLLIWFMSYVVYTAQLFSALTLDNNVSGNRLFVAVLMYFTYAQLFIILLFRSGGIYLWKRLVKNEVIGWDKTTRFRNRPTQR